MSTSNAPIRIRFPRDIVACLDALATKIGAVAGRTVPRAAVIRALVQTNTLDETSPELLKAATSEDEVKRGAIPGVKRRQRASRGAR